jgi:hypothetical protein
VFLGKVIIVEIKDMKTLSLGCALTKSIVLSDGFSIVPIGSWILEDSETVARMVSWREKAKDSFFSKVDSSSESMLWYLGEYSIADPNRILFLIRKGEEFLGHLGLSSISTGSAEIDNVMKSQDKSQTIESQQFFTIFVEFISWARMTLGICEFKLQVVSTNLPAIQLYSRAGFRSMQWSGDGHISPTKRNDGEMGSHPDGKSRIWMNLSLCKETKIYSG